MNKVVAGVAVCVGIVLGIFGYSVSSKLDKCDLCQKRGNAIDARLTDYQKKTDEIVVFLNEAIKRAQAENPANQAAQSQAPPQAPPQ